MFTRRTIAIEEIKGDYTFTCRVVSFLGFLSSMKADNCIFLDTLFFSISQIRYDELWTFLDIFVDFQSVVLCIDLDVTEQRKNIEEHLKLLVVCNLRFPFFPQRIYQYCIIFNSLLLFIYFTQQCCIHSLHEMSFISLDFEIIDLDFLVLSYFNIPTFKRFIFQSNITIPQLSIHFRLMGHHIFLPGTDESMPRNVMSITGQNGKLPMSGVEENCNKCGNNLQYEYSF